MSQKVGTTVGNYIGEFLEYDEKNDSLPWRKYMRIRVLVDVRLPLKRHKKIKKLDGDSKMVNFKYERLGTFCYVCGLLGHSENRCPKLFDMAATEHTRGWSPELRADMGKRQSGESKWLRHGGDPNWVAPDPIFTHIHGDSNTSGSNGSKADTGVNASQDERRKPIQLADIFKQPDILFPKPTASSNEDNKINQEMEEDDGDILILTGDRKRSRTNNSPKEAADTSQAREDKQNDSNNNPHNLSVNFLVAGPGGARQGQ
jgi:hypothetical protein